MTDPAAEPARAGSMPRLTATVPLLDPPAWALAERHPFDPDTTQPAPRKDRP